MLSKEQRRARSLHRDLCPVVDINDLPGKDWACLYTITNFITEDPYAGTTLNPYFRLEQHLVKGEKSCPDLHEAIKLWGAKNFQVRILLLKQIINPTDESREYWRNELEKEEEKVIEKLGSNIKNFGYNRVKGKVVAREGTMMEGNRHFGRKDIDRNTQWL